MVTRLKVPHLLQARMVSKRPDNVPFSLPSTKRVRASLPAQTEGRPMDSGGDQVSSPGGGGSVPEEAGQWGSHDHLYPHRLPCTWNPCTSCSVIAETTALRTWRPSCGPVPLSRPGKRVRAWFMGREAWVTQWCSAGDKRVKDSWEIQDRKGWRAGSLGKSGCCSCRGISHGWPSTASNTSSRGLDASSSLCGHLHLCVPPTP